ncbi:lysine N(6)-hydroxylase/L-ornithine N(5)-oxygenase family protein [Streptomyces fradiae]|uniref:lysine N(6)-hydroxylase/L-ornithine N(5)-oxygenase family protein n=1 Tax=Streptomyces fradiae TaxID=1906 RepID=UPI0037FE9D6C
MSAPQSHVDPDHVYDVVGVGFGPANLALAIALDEHNEAAAPGERVTGLFLERKQTFGWHRGLLIDGATMQVSFLKDLATLRNPVSRAGFVSYLHERGRLVDFINQKTFFPTREEFHDYLEWAAGRVGHLVRYGSEVTAVRPVATDGQTRLFEVAVRGGDGREVVHRARNVVVACGLQPRLPEGVAASDRVWHSGELLHHTAEFKEGAAPARFVVVGAGQSAAECAEYLHRTYPSAEVCAVLSRFGYSPADDSPYANRIFDPEAVDVYYAADDRVKARLMDYHRNTNYSVVDLDLIEELYRREYAEKVRGEQRLRILNVSRVTAVRETADAVTVSMTDLATGEQRELDADAVVFATGYAPHDITELFGGGCGLLRDEEGRLKVRRDYRVQTDPSVLAGVYTQGGTEHTHGITSSLLSMVAVRAGEILDSILRDGAPADDRPAGTTADDRPAGTTADHSPAGTTADDRPAALSGAHE